MRLAAAALVGLTACATDPTAPAVTRMSVESMDAFLAKAMEEAKAEELSELRVQEQALLAMLEGEQVDRLAEPARTRFLVLTRADVARLRFEAGNVAGAIEAVEASMKDAQASGIDVLVSLVAQDLYLILRFAAFDAAQVGYHDRSLQMLQRVSQLAGLDDAQRAQVAGDRFVVLDMKEKDDEPEAKEQAILAALGRVLATAAPVSRGSSSAKEAEAPAESLPMTRDDIRRQLSRQIGRDIAQAKLPQMRTVPAAETGRIDAAVVAKVVGAQKGSVSSCYNRALKSGKATRGKLELLVTVAPSGAVTDTAIESPAFRRDSAGRCIAETVKRWRFPPFGGAPQQVSIPFVLDF